MDEIRFYFWEVIKVLSLAFLALLSVKAIGGLRTAGAPEKLQRFSAVRTALYILVLALVVAGARAVGYDVAAELYLSASQDNLDRSQVGRAYDNALSAVRLRPSVVRYWQMLAATKLLQHQFESLLEDRGAFQTLSQGRLEESDELRFATARFFLGQYDQVISSTQEVIRNNRFFAAPYSLQGAAFMAERKYPEAERSFLDVLQLFPSQQDAVEGLAHVYFLMGDTSRALAVLNETARHPFSDQARKRFADLKALYVQR